MRAGSSILVVFIGYNENVVSIDFCQCLLLLRANTRENNQTLFNVLCCGILLGKICELSDRLRECGILLGVDM